MDIHELIEKVHVFFRRHRTLIMSCVACVVLLVVSSVLKSGVNSEIAEKERTLASVKNEITAEDTKAQKVVEVVAEPDHGLSTARWNHDDDVMIAWITPALTWNDLNEYITNRQFYVERLGAGHPFLRDFLVERSASYSYLDSYGRPVDDGTGINMKMESFKSYVVGIDEATGVYSYLALITVSSTDANGYVGTTDSNIVLLYDMTADGDVQNLRQTISSM